jgi:hypothetical protein
MSGDGKRGGAHASVLAPILDSTKWLTQLQVGQVPDRKVAVLLRAAFITGSTNIR